MFGPNCKIGLTDAILLVAGDILTDPLIQECLLERSTGGTAKDIVQNLEGYIALPVQTVSHHNITGQLGILLHRFTFRNRIILLSVYRFGKGLLQSDL